MPLKLNGTNSVAAPAYAGDDADTGLQCGTNELNLVTGGTSRVKIASDGAVQLLSSTGIDFSGIQTNASGMSSEILDSYEEGTWTATLTGATTAPTTAITMTGRYTKVGRIVTVSATFSGVDTTGASGQMEITGLPFAAVNDMQARAYSVAALSQFPMTDQYGIARVETNASKVRFFKTAGQFLALNITAGTGRYVAFSFSYEAA